MSLHKPEAYLKLLIQMSGFQNELLKGRFCNTNLRFSLKNTQKYIKKFIYITFGQ